MTKKEEIEAAYRELEEQWDKEFEEKRDKYPDNFITTYWDDYEDAIEDIERQKEELILAEIRAEKEREAKERELVKTQIDSINKQIDKLINLRRKLEFRLSYIPSEQEKLKNIIRDRDSKISSLLSKAKFILRREDELSIESIVDDYGLVAHSYSNMIRGSENYSVGACTIFSSSMYDDDYLALPKISETLSSYSEKRDERYINPKYPDRDKWVEQIAKLEKELKDKIREDLEQRYNKEEHIEYLTAKKFNYTDSSDTAKLMGIVKELGLDKEVSIIIEQLSKYPKIYENLLLYDLVIYLIENKDKPKTEPPMSYIPMIPNFIYPPDMNKRFEEERRKEWDKRYRKNK